MTIDTTGSSTIFHKETFLLYLKSNIFIVLLTDITSAMYVNYEVLCNAFATKIIDLSKAEIYMLKTTEMSVKELETFL